jgi:hypothetical protein
MVIFNDQILNSKVIDLNSFTKDVLTILKKQNLTIEITSEESVQFWKQVLSLI